jgi:hypothetical protein
MPRIAGLEPSATSFLMRQVFARIRKVFVPRRASAAR